MAFDHGIGNGTAPFQSADREDGKAAVAGDIPQISGEVTFTLPSEARDTVGRHTRQDGSVHGHGLQEFQPAEQPVHVGRVLAHLKLAQPDKAGDRTVRHFRQQGVKSTAHLIIQPVGNPSVDPSLCSNECIRAKAFDNRDPW
jgi:hypothetical protein